MTENTDTLQLIALLSSPHEEVRAESARALGYLGQKESEVVGVALLFHSDQQSLVRSGAAQLISDEGKAYAVVVRRVLSDKLIIAGISLEQAQILTTFRQHIGPQITTFVAEVSHPFSFR